MSSLDRPPDDRRASASSADLSLRSSLSSPTSNPPSLAVAESPLDGLDPRYAGFFACFNSGRFFEAHEVLEPLWLGIRGRPDADFHKGLIQLAGAFVHLQKARAGPAMSLLRLARANLQRYQPVKERLDIGTVLVLIDAWHAAVDRTGVRAWTEGTAPTMLPAQPG
ncbi:MAG: DUF309 domain-containing protein [Limisphaerales bacterium]